MNVLKQIDLKTAYLVSDELAELYNDCKGIVLFDMTDRSGKNLGFGIDKDGGYVLRLPGNMGDCIELRNSKTMEVLRLLLWHWAISEGISKRDFQLDRLTWMMDADWQGDVIDEVGSQGEMTRSDAQGVLMAHGYELVLCRARELDAKQTATILLERSQVPLVPERTVTFLASDDDGVSGVLIDGKIAFVCHGVAGEQASRTLDEYDSSVPPTKDEIDAVSEGEEIWEVVHSLAEARAFWRGISLGTSDFFATPYAVHQAFFGTK